MDKDLFNRFIKFDYPHVYRVLAYAEDQEVLSFYRPGYKNKTRPILSITKSVISTLYGIAHYQGHFSSLDEKILSYFPAYSARLSGSKAEQISIRNLLTMTSGIGCSDRNPKGFFKSKNWVEHYLHLSVTSNPGSKFSYSSASSHLLSALLTKITGLNTYDYAKTYLFWPLGISKSKWKHDKQGNYTGGFGLDLSPDSLLKLGGLYLNLGIVDGERLLSEKYIGEATTRHVDGGFPENDGYGYHWWVGQKDEIKYFYGAGLGGQYLFVVPEFGIRVIITSDARKPHIENKKIFTEKILPELAGTV